MSIVYPFRGLRPRSELAQAVASPPYDVLSSDEARAMVRDNPNSFLRVNKSEVDFPPDTPLYGEAVYNRGKDNLERLIAEKIMIRDEKPGFYLYRLTWLNQSQTGLVSLASVDEYDQGLIKKHEHTRPEKVSDRANHIMTLQAQVGPVFTTFRHSDELRTLFGRLTSSAPAVDFTSDDTVQHQLWVVDEPGDVAAIETAFGKLPGLYIADGHHRSQSASEVCRRMRQSHPGYTGQEIFNYFLHVCFPDDELRILAYNRVVKDLGGLTAAQVLDGARQFFEVKTVDDPIVPQRNHCLGLYMDRQWHLLTAKEGTYDAGNPAHSIDSAILTKNLLAPVLGISDIRTDNRIGFVGGIRGVDELIKLVDSDKYKIAFSMHPVTVGQLLDVADAGEVMPPKSTWFEPKLRSGMVVNLLNEQ